MKKPICLLLLFVYLFPFGVLAQTNVEIEWARSYGAKDIDTKAPVTTETLFQAGSISKPVAAMVALKRVQDGKIALDENINNKLQTGKLPDNEFTATKKVTLANLLSHTANGEKELAITNYKKSVELNPNNNHGAEMLKKLTANEQ